MSVFKNQPVMRIAKMPTAHRASTDVKKPTGEFPARIAVDGVPSEWEVGERLVIQGEDYRILNLDGAAGWIEVEPWGKGG